MLLLLLLYFVHENGGIHNHNIISNITMPLPRSSSHRILTADYMSTTEKKGSYNNIQHYTTLHYTAHNSEKLSSRKKNIVATENSINIKLNKTLIYDFLLLCFGLFSVVLIQFFFCVLHLVLPVYPEGNEMEGF